MNHRLDPISCYHSGPEWSWEWWHWRGTLHSPKLQHHLTIRLFSVIFRTLIGGGCLTPLQRSSHCILQPQPIGQIPEENVAYEIMLISWSVPGISSFVLFGWFVRWEVSGCTAAVLWGVTSRICEKQHILFSCSSHPAFSLSILLMLRRWIHAEVLIQPQLVRNPILFYQKDQTSIWSISCQQQFMFFLCVC